MLLCQNDVGLKLMSEKESVLLDGAKQAGERMSGGANNDGGGMGENEGADEGGDGLLIASSSTYSTHPRATTSSAGGGSPTTAGASGGRSNRIMCWGSVGGSVDVEGVNVASSSTVSSLRSKGKGKGKASASASACDDDDDDDEDGDDDDDCDMNDDVDNDDDDDVKNIASQTASPLSWQLRKLPKFVVYNILEYLHWDWFEVCIHSSFVLNNANTNSNFNLLYSHHAGNTREKGFNNGPILIYPNPNPTVTNPILSYPILLYSHHAGNTRQKGFNNGPKKCSP